MTIAQLWPRFVASVRQHAPRTPVGTPTRNDRIRGNMSNIAGAAGAALDGVGSNLGRAAGVASIAIAATDSREAALNSAADMGISEGAGFVTVAEAGPIVGTLIGLLRGTYQALDREDQMLRYLLGLSGYIDGLSRLSAKAVFSNSPVTDLLANDIPRYIMSQGDLFSGHRRQKWLAGVHLANRVAQQLDHGRRQNPAVSKQLFIELTMQSRAYNFRSIDSIRQNVQEFITRNILHLNMHQQRTALRRWANAA